MIKELLFTFCGHLQSPVHPLAGIAPPPWPPRPHFLRLPSSWPLHRVPSLTPARKLSLKSVFSLLPNISFIQFSNEVFLQNRLSLANFSFPFSCFPNPNNHGGIPRNQTLWVRKITICNLQKISYLCLLTSPLLSAYNFVTNLYKLSQGISLCKFGHD